MIGGGSFGSARTIVNPVNIRSKKPSSGFSPIWRTSCPRDMSLASVLEGAGGGGEEQEGISG